MKGISAIIAVVLILLITVALAASAYIFFSTTFSGVTQTAGTTISGTISQFQSSFIIESAYNSTSTAVNFTIRNTGQTSLNIATTTIGVYINEVPQSSISLISGTSPLTAGQVARFGVTLSSAVTCNSVLKVTIPGVAAPQTALIRC